MGSKPHYVNPARTATTPRVLYVLDTETETIERGTDKIERLRLWCAATIERPKLPDSNLVWSWHSGGTAAGVASSLDLAATRHGTVWCYSHNLAFDLTTTTLPEHLARLGWTVTDFALSASSPWMKLAQGKRRIVCADSVSLLPESITDIARSLGMRRPRLPSQTGARGRWEARCRADVEILGSALCTLMAWHEREAGGPWSVSGTAVGWGHLRARLPGQTLVVDPRPSAKARDRQAIYGGRRQAWRVGSWAGHRYLELDLKDAYPTAAAHTLLPCHRRGTFERLDLADRILRVGAVGVLAVVGVRTATPRYPMRTPQGVVYPVGEFSTCLAGPELQNALSRGDVTWIGAGEVHDVADHLRPWAEWVVGQRYGRPPEIPAVATLLCKRNGRAVIGKLAGHGWTRQVLGPAPGLSWRYEPAIDMDSGGGAAVVDLAGTRYLTLQDDSGDNAYPAVLAWIEARVRVVLGRVIDMLGPGCLLAADTDGVVAVERTMGTTAAHGSLVAPTGLWGAARTGWVVERVNEAISPFQLRVKRTVLSAEVRGPQHVTMGGQMHLPGMPATARRDDDDLYRFAAWPSLQWQMGHGDTNGYIRPLVVRKIGGPNVAGWVTDTGEVVPAAAQIDADGSNRLLPWLSTPGRPRRALLASGQHPALADL